MLEKMVDEQTFEGLDNSRERANRQIYAYNTREGSKGANIASLDDSSKLVNKQTYTSNAQEGSKQANTHTSPHRTKQTLL